MKFYKHDLSFGWVSSAPSWRKSFIINMIPPTDRNFNSGSVTVEEKHDWSCRPCLRECLTDGAANTWTQNTVCSVCVTTSLGSWKWRKLNKRGSNNPGRVNLYRNWTAKVWLQKRKNARHQRDENSKCAYIICLAIFLNNATEILPLSSWKVTVTFK